MKHNNPSFAEWFSRIFNLKTSDQPSNDVLPYITPVVEIDSPVNFVWSGAPATTGTLTIFTTPSEKDTYITEAQLSFSKNAACDIATGHITIQAVLSGVTKDILRTAVLTLTAERDSVTASFDPPIKVDRARNVQVTGSFTAGACIRTAVVMGYTVEVTK